MTQPKRDTVDVLQVRFPRLYAEEAVAFLLGKLRSGESAGVCFPDMSTLNQAFEKPAFRRLLQRRMIVLPWR